MENTYIRYFGSLENPNGSNKHVTSVLLEHGTLIPLGELCSQKHQTLNVRRATSMKRELVPENRPKLPQKGHFNRTQPSIFKDNVLVQGGYDFGTAFQ